MKVSLKVKRNTSIVKLDWEVMNCWNFKAFVKLFLAEAIVGSHSTAKPKRQFGHLVVYRDVVLIFVYF